MRKAVAVSTCLFICTASAGAFGRSVTLDSACPISRQPQVVTSFCNAGAIPLPAAGASSNYPSAITVSGLSGVISNVNVRLRSVTHSNTSTIEALLQPPTGSPIGLLGTSAPVKSPDPPNAPLPVPTAAGSTWTFSDQAPDYALFAQSGVVVAAATAPTESHDYLPRTFMLSALPAPAPTVLESQLLSSQIGHAPNGVWQLFVAQEVLNTAGNPQPTGAIAGGWCVDIATAPADTGCYATSSFSGAIAASDALQAGRVTRNAVPTLCTIPKTTLLQNSTMVHYDATSVLNAAGQPTCATASADFSGCGAGSTELVIYSAFDPTHPATGHLADPGFSSFGHLQTSFKLAAHQNFTVVVHETTPSAGCPAYSVRLEQNPCTGAAAGDRILTNGFDP